MNSEKDYLKINTDSGNQNNNEIQDNNGNNQLNDNIEKQCDNTSSFDSNTQLKHIEWTVENEMILVDWCDIAQCYKWLNYQSYLKYSLLQAWFTIPVIIMSTVTGTAAFAQSSFTDTQKFYVQFGIGSINILVGILSTISQYLKISQLTESHRVSSISWDKYSRNIRIELAKSPDERMDAAHFLKLSRHEFDRLMETSPTIQPDIIVEFKKQFMGNEGTEQRRLYVELRKPDICDTIMSSSVYRHKWYEQKNIVKPSIKLDRPINYVIQETPLATKETIQQVFKENIFTIAKKMKINKEKIEKYVEMFKQTYGREPLKNEVEDHFQKTMDKITLERYFESSLQSESIV
jgi:hypothetical protein